MSQIVTVQIRDELYTALRQQAETAGVSVSEWIAVALEQTVAPADYCTDAGKEAARQRFRRHAGAIDLGYPIGADNQSIDADLIRAYSDGLS